MTPPERQKPARCRTRSTGEKEHPDQALRRLPAIKSPLHSHSIPKSSRIKTWLPTIVFFSLFIVFFMLKKEMSALPGLIRSTALLTGGISILIYLTRNLKMTVIFFVLFMTYTIYRVPGLPVYVTISDVLLTIGVLAWLFRMVLRFKVPVHPIGYEMSFIILFLLSIIKLPDVSDLTSSIAEVTQSLEYLFILPLFICSIINSLEDISQILDVLLISSVWAAVLGVIQFYFIGGRVFSIMSHFNEFGGFLAVTTPIAFVLYFFEKRQISKIAYFFAFAIMFGATILTLSRGAWIAIGASFVFISFLGNFTVVTGIAAISTIILMFGFQYLPKNWIERANVLFEIDANRKLQYTVAWEMMKEQPVFGVGTSNALEYSKKYLGILFERGAIGGIHNLYLMIAAERGLPAAFALVVILVSSLYRIIQNYKTSISPKWKQINFALATGMFGYIVNNLSGYHFHRAPGMVLGLTLGLIAASERIMRRENEAQMVREGREQRRRVRRGEEKPRE